MHVCRFVEGMYVEEAQRQYRDIERRRKRIFEVNLHVSPRCFCACEVAFSCPPLPSAEAELTTVSGSRATWF